MIKALRVDDRLIHGQVQTQWIAEYSINRIIIIDDNVANDNITLQILKIAKPPNIDLVVCGTDRAMSLIEKDSKQTDAKTFIIFKTIATADEMMKKGLKFSELIVGPTSSKKDSVQMQKNTYFTKEELDAAINLMNNGIDVEFQLLPSEPKVSLKKVLENK